MTIEMRRESPSPSLDWQAGGRLGSDRRNDVGNLIVAPLLPVLGVRMDSATPAGWALLSSVQVEA